VWEARLVDVAGEPRHRALDAVREGKDDRILPQGWNPDPIDLARVEPVGVVADATFVAGSDAIKIHVPGLAAGATISVELQYQSVSPRVLDAIAETPTPASARFGKLTAQRAPLPTTIGRATLTW
jgi:hypothetical protein